MMKRYPILWQNSLLVLFSLFLHAAVAQHVSYEIQLNNASIPDEYGTGDVSIFLKELIESGQLITIQTEAILHNELYGCKFQVFNTDSLQRSSDSRILILSTSVQKDKLGWIDFVMEISDQEGNPVAQKMLGLPVAYLEDSLESAMRTSIHFLLKQVIENDPAQTIREIPLFPRHHTCKPNKYLASEIAGLGSMGPGGYLLVDGINGIQKSSLIIHQVSGENSHPRRCRLVDFFKLSSFEEIQTHTKTQKEPSINTSICSKPK